jgi:phosphoglycerol transferase MdoB-like AlkP superfamily enzyme
MFVYFALLNIYFRLFLFLLNPNNLWHWRIPFQGIMQDLVAAAVFYLFFKVLFTLVPGRKLKSVIFLSFTSLWIFINFTNYEYADTFNKLLPLSWFAELVNLNSMGSFSDLVLDYVNIHTFLQVILPLVVCFYLVIGHGDRLFKPLRIKAAIVIFLFGSVCQAVTLDPGIQPMWDSTVHSHLLKYWYYSYDDIPHRRIRETPLRPFSPLFREVVLERSQPEQITVPRVQAKKPNIVFVMLESFRANEIGAFGSDLGLTPNFDRYAEKGLLFTEIYSSDHLTKTGQWSYLCGAYKHMGGSVLTFYKDQASVCLPDILNDQGYDNWWFHGQSASYDFQGYFMKRHGVSHIMDRLTFPQDAKVMGWGLADRDLMDHALNHLEESEEPFFWIVQSQSNHHPYVVPPEFEKDRDYPNTISKFLNTFQYTDDCLGYFLDRFLKTKAGKNSLIVVAADHGSSKDLTGRNRMSKALHLQKYQIPILILYPQSQEIQPRRIDALGGQVDLMPTLLDILDIQPQIPIFGKSLVRKYKHRYSKGMTPSIHWLLVADHLYTTHPKRQVLTKKGEKLSVTESNQQWFNLSFEIDDVQDWIISQENRTKLYQTLEQSGWDKP